MNKTVDILDSNIVHLMMLGMDSVNTSLPVLYRDENDELFIATFVWSANKKQRNVPAPEHVVLNPLHAGSLKLIDVPECGLEPTHVIKQTSGWTHRALCRDFDEIIETINTTGEVPIPEYLFYLENMLPHYDKSYYPLFKALNLPQCNIDLVKPY